MKLPEEDQAKITQHLIDANEYELVQRFINSQAEIGKPDCSDDYLKSEINRIINNLEKEQIFIPDGVLNFIRESALKEIG